MKITILGAGNIGSTLGKKWAAAGHEVAFGSRDVASPKVQALIDVAGGRASAHPIPEAIAAGEAILFALPWAAVPEIASTNADALEAKILIDATNNFGGSLINNMDVLRSAAPNARLFRAFNSLGWEVFERPIFKGMPVDLFYTGPDGGARQRVEGLIKEVGLRPVWVGDNDRVLIVDYLGALWVSLALRQGWGRGVALKLLERD